MKKFALLIILLSFAAINAQSIVKKGSSYFLNDRIVVKFKNTAKTDAMGKLSVQAVTKSKFENFGITELSSAYKDAGGSEIGRISIIKFSAPYQPEVLCRAISKIDEVEWAEPYFVYELEMTPNDPDYVQQYYLPIISAESAWDVNQGSSDIIIAIVDTGIDWNHPDLAANIWSNDDPVNGIDDDNNGYIDDLRGWDFGGNDGTPDNDPMEDKADHGSWVAGCASAITNNGIGIASIGYNSTLMPVKVTRNDMRFDNGSPMVIFGFDGIKYAADNGADIINCSWGGSSYSNYGKEIIDYANSKGATVVAAAGNEGVTEIIYPSAYDGVLSVGASNQSDQMWYASNYGIKLDVMAPGQNIYSTKFDDGYSIVSGTSVASPIVSGLAAVVKNQFPTYTNLQIAEQIRATCDNIDANNSGKEYMLGAGRINAYKALTDNQAKSVRAVNYTLIDNGDGDGIPEPGESFSIEADFVNYLLPVDNLQIQMTSSNANVTVTAGTFNPGSKQMLEAFASGENVFTFTISETAEANSDVDFFFTYSDGDYSDFQWYRTTVHPTFATQSGNEIAVTISSKGLLGFDELDAPTKGDGFRFSGGPNLIYIGSFMYGTNDKNVVSAVSLDGNENYDFQTVVPFTMDIPGNFADVEGSTIFNDAMAPTPHNIETRLYSYSFSDMADENYIILRYKLLNISGAEISGLYAGLFLDWDIDESDYENNTALYDPTDKFGYAFNTDRDPVATYVGAALVSDGATNYYALMNDASDGGIGIYDGFTDAEKWQTMSGGIQKTEAGNGDVSFTIAGGPYTIAAGNSADVSFALAAGNDLTSLRTSIQNAKVKYGEIPTGLDEKENLTPLKFSLEQNYPNPFNPETTIKFQLVKSGNVKLEVFNALGQRVAVLINSQMSAGSHAINFNASRLSSGIYFYRLTSGMNTSIKKMTLLK